MVIDTERVRRHVRAALAALPLLACEPAAPSPAPDESTEARATPTDPMQPHGLARPATPAAVAVPSADVEVTDDPARRRREIQHAELRKHPPPPVSGRPLRQDGRDVLSLLRRVDVVGDLTPLGAELPDDARAEIAAGWLRDARYEHASVASLERAADELAMWDAPQALIDATREAAAQEMVHTSECLALAWRYGAPPLAPGPLAPAPLRPGTLTSLALDLFEEGCVNETYAAVVAASGARRAEVRDVREVLGRIADDESDHAGIAWASLRWVLSRDPDASVAVRARAVELRPPDRLASLAPLGPLAAHGRITGADLARAHGRAWTALIDPLLEEALSPVCS